VIWPVAQGHSCINEEPILLPHFLVELLMVCCIQTDEGLHVIEADVVLNKLGVGAVPHVEGHEGGLVDHVLEVVAMSSEPHDGVVGVLVSLTY